MSTAPRVRRAQRVCLVPLEPSETGCVRRGPGHAEEGLCRVGPRGGSSREAVPSICLLTSFRWACRLVSVHLEAGLPGADGRGVLLLALDGTLRW